MRRSTFIAFGVGALALMFLGGSSSPLKKRQTKGKRAGIIGDSLSDTRCYTTPGKVLQTRLEDLGYTVEVNAIGGRSARSFMAGTTHAKFMCGKKQYDIREAAKGEKQLEDWISEFAPETVFVVLGTNDVSSIAVTATKDQAAAMKLHLAAMGKIIKQLRDAGVTVIGIGPPSFSPDTEVNYKGNVGRPYVQSQTYVPELEELFGPEYFIDSRPLTDDILTYAQGRQKDGIHFLKEGAALWMDRVMDELQ